MKEFPAKRLGLLAIAGVRLFGCPKVAQCFIAECRPPWLDPFSGVVLFQRYSLKSACVVGVLSSVDIILQFCRRTKIALEIMCSAFIAMVNKTIVPKNKAMHEEPLSLMCGNSIAARKTPRKMRDFWNIVHVDYGKSSLRQRNVSDRWTNGNVDWTRVVFMRIMTGRHRFLHTGFMRQALTGEPQRCL